MAVAVDCRATRRPAMTDRGTISRLAYTAALTSDLARPRCITVSEVCNGFRPRSTPKNPFKGGKGLGGTCQLDRFLSQLSLRLCQLVLHLSQLGNCFIQLGIRLCHYSLRLSQLFQPAGGL